MNDPATSRPRAPLSLALWVAAILALGALAGVAFLWNALNDTLPSPTFAELAASTLDESLKDVEGAGGEEDSPALSPDVAGEALTPGLVARDLDAPKPDAFLVADFDQDGETEREWESPVGSWISDPADATIHMVEAHDPLVRVGEKGQSLKLWYDLDSPHPAFGGLALRFRKGGAESLDLTGYGRLALFVRGGKSRTGHSSRLKIELHSKSQSAWVELAGITDEWKRFEIPLTDFKGITDWTRMTEMRLLLEQSHVDRREGILYFDEIEFCK